MKDIKFYQKVINKMIYILNRWNILDRIPDETYLQYLFFLTMGYKLNLNDPKTFNEKLAWLKLNDHNPLYTVLADKYEVKFFVSSVIGSEYVVPNLGVWNSFEEIAWDELPDQFVLKATHNSGGVVICRDKKQLHYAELEKQYRELLKTNYFHWNREWPYKNIKPRIIADEFLNDNTSEGRRISLRDYKFWCFNGKPLYMYCTVKDNDIYENFYDEHFNEVHFNHCFPRHKPEFEKPKNYEKMLELAEKLATASGTAFVRVDFFNVDGRIYFGEFTFYDWGGTRPFESFEQDMFLGQLISLP